MTGPLAFALIVFRDRYLKGFDAVVIGVRWMRVEILFDQVEWLWRKLNSIAVVSLPFFRRQRDLLCVGRMCGYFGSQVALSNRT